MATVHVGRLLSAAGFARTVAVKRPLPALTRDADFRRLAWNEARLGSRVSHANVVTTLDVIEHGSELLVVMDYVHGESLSQLMTIARERGEPIPVSIVRALMVGVLRGLDAVHQARDEKGRALGLIHRDVSPQNVLCGVDGIVRLGDFGLAKAARDAGSTRPGEFKGKLTYASPEQLGLCVVTARTDLFSAGLILWELLVGCRVHEGLTPNGIAARLLRGSFPAPSSAVPGIAPALDAVFARATERDPARRFESAPAMIAAIEATGPVATTDDLASWVRRLAHEPLARREKLVRAAESQTTPSRRGLELHPGGQSPNARSSLALKLAGVSVGAAIAMTLGHFALGTREPEPRTPPEIDRAQIAWATPVPPPSAPKLELQAQKEALPRVEPRLTAPVARRGARAAPARDCSPPFTLDAQGIRRMKPGCE
jgi:serine/threonine-protein kinase